MNTLAVESKTTFASARRVNLAITAEVERQALEWMANKSPRWLTSDQLTALGLVAQFGAGAAYALSGYNHNALLVATFCICLNWFGDSMDGTLARVRNQQRPRFGFYVDHVVDVLGATAMMTGLGLSGFVHWQIALGMLISFLLLSSESYLATYTLSEFKLSGGIFGPTEIRILLICGNLALLHNPIIHFNGHRLLLFDLGGIVASFAMSAIFLSNAVQHTAQLYLEEPLP